jgi:hypothetical protein
MRTDRGSTNSPGANLHARSAARRVGYMDVQNTNSPGANLHARSAARRAEGRKPGVILPAEPGSQHIWPMPTHVVFGKWVDQDDSPDGYYRHPHG